MELDYETMFEAGVHIGHQVKRWNPKFGPYVYRHIHGISVIDLEKTRACLEKAATFLTEQIREGATVLLVGTKPQSQELIRSLGQATGMPFCANRWLGGCLTNFKTIQSSLEKYRRFLAMEESGELGKMFKKESSVIRRQMVRMHRGFEGLLELKGRPHILFAVDALKEAIALREARRLQIPTVGIVDTNSDPSLLDYPIPANDDSAKALGVLFDYLKEAMEQGVELEKLNKSHKYVSIEVASSPKAKSWEQKRPFGASKAPFVKREGSSGGFGRGNSRSGGRRTDFARKPGAGVGAKEAAKAASGASVKPEAKKEVSGGSEAGSQKSAEAVEKSAVTAEAVKAVTVRASSEETKAGE